MDFTVKESKQENVKIFCINTLKKITENGQLAQKQT